jgi:hypothetical protein
MGCSSNKAQIQPQAVIKVLTYSSHTTRNLPTSVLDDGKPEVMCMKIRIYDTKDQDWDEINTKLLEMPVRVYQSCQKVFSLCNQFQSFYSYLEKLVHGVCIENFSLVTALEMIFLFCKVNNVKVLMKKHKFFGFLQTELQDELDFVIAWNKVGWALEEIIAGKELEGSVRVIREVMTDSLFINDSNEQNKRFFVLGSYLALYTDTYEEVKVLSKGLLEFLGNFKSLIKAVYRKIDSFRISEGMSFVTIVHLMS